MHKALIIVDVQYDFVRGTLAVPDAEAVIGPLLEASKAVELVVASRDWHTPDHLSFKAFGGIWPVHCVADTLGAAIEPVIAGKADIVVSKATTSAVDAYSAFDGTNLAKILKERGIDTLVVGGLATDYCVKATVLDAIKAGFAVELLVDGIRAVDVEAGDGDKAIEEMVQAGAMLV